MPSNGSTGITVQEFSRTFEQMCNFMAVAKTGDPAATVRGLVMLCLLDAASEAPDGARGFSDTIAILYGIRLPEFVVEVALGQLEGSGAIKRPWGKRYVLTPAAAGPLASRVRDAKELEIRVETTWRHQILKSHPKLPGDAAWKALRSYLAGTFRRHGIQAAALLDPAIGHSAEQESGLSELLRASVGEHVPANLRTEGLSALSGFMATLGSDGDRSRYVSQLADGAFNFYTLEVPAELSDSLRSKLRDLTLFLDTNFLFGILDLHYNTQVQLSHDLMRAIAVHKFPFRLRYHEATGVEMRSTVAHYGALLRSRLWTGAVSRAASHSRNLSGIEQKFHERNGARSLDVDEFLRPYEHLDVLLAEKGIKVYRPHEDRRQARIDLFADYQEFLKKTRRLEKPYEVVMHDATVLEEVRRLRADAPSSLDAGALFVSCDYYLYRFDWASARHHGARACVLLPNMFWQVLRPFVPVDQDFDRAFAETFALPEFRALGSGGARASSKMLQVLAAYKDVPEETAFNMLANDLLLERLRSAPNDVAFREQVEAALVEENRSLLEERAAIEAELASEKSLRLARERDVLSKDKILQKREKEVLEQRAALEARERELSRLATQRDEGRRALDEASDAAKRADAARRAADVEKGSLRLEKEAAERTARRLWNAFFITAAIVATVLVEVAIQRGFVGPWLLRHPQGFGLRGCIGMVVACSIVGIGVKPWRRWCLGVACLGALLVMLQIVGGPSSVR